MFNKSNFCHIASNNRNDQKGSVFIYKTTDTLAQVTQSGYFNEKLIDINVHDLIIHVQYDQVARTLKKSVLIVTERTLDNVETAPILDQTIGDDIDQLGDQIDQLGDQIADLGDQVAGIGDQVAGLGDQVAGIEEKIPENASAQNQLATSQGLAQKQDIATAVNYDNITNCITEIPQDIKLELNNGTLTLKAGSKVYVPNGAGVFDVVNITADKTITSTNDGQRFIFVNQNNNLQEWNVSSCYSGSTAPTSEHYPLWYDTTNNIIKRSNDYGSTWAGKFSLPIAIVTVSNGAISSIDQVFNGFGYIGSTVFALPGVKGLIPNGRNEDGSLKNITTADFTTVKTVQVNTSTAKIAMYAGGGIGSQTKNFGLNEPENYNYDSGILTNTLEVASVIVDSNAKITAFTPKTTFHAVDYSDTEYMAHQAMPSGRYVDLNLGASGTSYTAPDDGWFVVAKSSAGTNEYINMVDTKTNLSTATNPSSSGVNCRVFLPTSKNNVVTISYNLTGTTNTFRFIYANGAK